MKIDEKTMRFASDLLEMDTIPTDTEAVFRDLVEEIGLRLQDKLTLKDVRTLALRVILLSGSNVDFSLVVRMMKVRKLTDDECNMAQKSVQFNLIAFPIEKPEQRFKLEEFSKTLTNILVSRTVSTKESNLIRDFILTFEEVVVLSSCDRKGNIGISMWHDFHSLGSKNPPERDATKVWTNNFKKIKLWMIPAMIRITEPDFQSVREKLLLSKKEDK